jgi:hypothetical protein
LNSGGYDVVEWVRFAHESVLFDVAAIPLTRCPTAIAPEGSDMQDAITFEEMTSSGGEGAAAIPQMRSAPIELRAPRQRNCADIR